MIVSASRRCDLPAFGFDDFLRSLDLGFTDVRNPFDAASVRRLSLAPEAVDCIVFWTRDPRRLVRDIDRLGPFRDRFLVHVTITSYPRALEPRVLSTEDAVAATRALARLIGADRIVWRYDPLVLAAPLDPAWHLAAFGRLAEALADSTSRVALSLLDEYARTRSRLERAGYGSPAFGSPRGAPTAPPGAESSSLPPEPWPDLLGALARTAADRGLPVGACAEPYDLASLGIGAEACVDGARLGRLFGFVPPAGRDKGQRGACRCSPSVDIGSYGACPAGCVYCYARR